MAMNNEEKQAIERLRKYQKAVITEPTLIDAIETVLNLIEKQQEEISRYERTLHDQIIKDCNLELDLKAEIENKDKIIDEMAKQLTTPIHSKEWVIEYYTKEVEEK